MTETDKDPEAPYDGQQLQGPSDEEPPRQGHLFFGFLCDMRVATIGVNMLNIGLLLYDWSILRQLYYTFFEVFRTLFWGFFLSGLAIYGAVEFRFGALAAAALGFAIGTVTKLALFNIAGFFVSLFVLYPTVVMAHHVKKGILSKETYPETAVTFSLPRL